jgi:hypothetical protein
MARRRFPPPWTGGCISASLSARLRGHCEQTAWLGLSSWPLTALDQGQKSVCASGEARGRRRLGAIGERNPHRRVVALAEPCVGGVYPLLVRQPRLPPKKPGRGGRRQSRLERGPHLTTGRLCLFETLWLMLNRRFPPPWSPITRPARDDDVLPAFRRRCLSLRVAPARRMAHSVGKSDSNETAYRRVWMTVQRAKVNCVDSSASRAADPQEPITRGDGGADRRREQHPHSLGLARLFQAAIRRSAFSNTRHRNADRSRSAVVEWRSGR